ncbi:tenascin-X-like [Branchiostoma floridae x Branchiostoma belcheri]
MVPSPKHLDLDVKEDSITVKWTEVSGDITGFAVQIKEVANDDEPLEHICDAKSTSHELTQLTSGREYLISVLALSGDKRSQPRSIIQYTRVRPPVQVEVETGTDFIRIDWMPPDGDVEWYDIAIADMFGNRFLKTISGAVSSYTVTDDKLTAGTSYTVTLESRCGEYRSGQPFMQQVTTIPVAPLLEVSRHDIGHEHLTVYWSEATGNVDRYIISLDPTNHGNRSVPKDSERKCTFSELTPGKEYTIKIYSEVNGSRSRPVEQHIFTQPFPPVSIDIKESDITETSMLVIWKPPLKGEVKEWHLQISPKTSNVTGLSEHKKIVVQAQPSQDLLHTFSGLTPGRLYDVWIFAESGGQCSEERKITRRTNVSKPKIVVHKHMVGLQDITVECEPLEGDSDSYEVKVALAINPTSYVNGVTNLETGSHWKHRFASLSPGTEYEISAIARSGDKRSEPFTTTVRTRVDMPSDLRIVEQDEDSATISWSAAMGSVDEYKIVLSTCDGEMMTERSVRATEERKLNFANLVPGRMYRASVSSAVIDKQNEDVVAKSTIASLDFRAKVKKPDVTVERASVETNSLRISWHDVSGDRERYRVSISPPDSDKSESLVTAPRVNNKKKMSHVFKNLTPGKMYTVTVVAIVGEDESEGASIQQRTKPDTPKLRKGNSVVTERQYFIEWDHSEGEFDKYQLTLKPVVNEMMELCPQGTLETKENSMVVNLVQGVKYCISLRAISGEETSSTETSTVKALPAQPLDVRVLSTDTTITVIWKEPEGAKDVYVVKLSSKMEQTRVHEIKHGEQLETCFNYCIRGRVYELEIYTVAFNDNEQAHSLPICLQKQTVVSKPVVHEIKKQTNLTSISVSWPEVDGDKTRYCLSIHEPTGQCIASRDIGIKNKGWLFSNSYQQTFNGLCPGRQYEIRALTHSGDGMSDSTSILIRTEVSPVRNIQIEPSSSDTGFTVKWDHVIGDVDKFIVALQTSTGIEINTVEVKEATHTFENHKPGVKYHIRVKSVSGDKVSTEEEVTTIVRPCKPKDLTVMSNGPQSLKVSWREAKGEKTHYVVTISPNIRGGNGEKRVEKGQPLVCTYSGLTSGCKYTVTVITVSEDVEGYPVEKSETTLVSAPRNVFVKDRLEDTLTVSWTPSEGCADRYHVRAVPVVSSGSSTTSEIVASVEHTNNEIVCPVGTLQPGTCYDIYVKAESNGRYSHESHTQTSTLIGRVTGIDISDETTESFKVSWIESPGQKTHYILYVDPSEEVIVHQGQDKTLNYEFTGLQPGLEYKVVIHTGNDTAKSKPTETIAWTRPIPPKNVERASVGQDSLTVRWCCPEDGSYDNYKVSINPSDDESVEVEGDTTEHTFNDVEVLTATEHSLPVTWSHAYGDKDSYKLRLLLDKTEVESATVPVHPGETHGQLSYTFPNLNAGHKYELEISTLSGKRYSAVKRYPAQTRPSPPQHVTVAKYGTEGLKVTWQEAEGMVTSYGVDISPSDGWKKQQVQWNSENSYEWTYSRLTPGRNYTISVRTVSGEAESEPVEKKETTVVAKPENVHVERREETSLTLHWNPSKGDKIGYHMTIRPLVSEPSSNDVVQTDFVTHKNNEEPIYMYIFENLQPGKQYVMTLKTESHGNYSEEVTVKKQTLVSPTKCLEVVDIMTENLTLTWSEADGDKDYYQVEISPADGSNTTGNVKAGEDTRYTFSGLTPGKRYGVSILTVSGGERSQVKTISDRTFPNAPVNLVTNIVDRGIKVAWQPVEGELDSYLLHLKPSEDTHENGDEVWHTVGKCDPPSHTFPDLVCGRLYEITVRTVSDNKQSSLFSVKQRLTIDTPKALKESSRKERKITVAWESATGDKDCYRVQLLNGDTSVKEEDTANTSWSSDGLIPGTLYTICVQTVCERETSDVTSIQVRTVACSPTSMYVENVTERTISVSWPDADGNKDKYSVQICDEKGIEVDSTELASTILEKTFKHLVPGRLYQICIKSLCINDDKSTSSPIRQHQRTKVAQPGNIDMESVGLHRMSFSWGKALGDVDYYTIDVSSDGPDENIPKLDSVSKDCCLESTVDGLTAGRLYTISVTAVSGGDYGDPRTLSVRTNVGKPRQPQIAAVGENTLVVIWDHATGDKDRYMLTIDPKHATCTSIDADDELRKGFTNLVPGTFYRISITTIKSDHNSEVSSCEGWTRPLPPAKIHLSNVLEKSITVSWDHVSEGGYEKCKVSIDPNDAVECLLSADNQTHVFNGLTPGREYTVSIVTVCGDTLISRRKTSRKRTTVNTPDLTIESQNITKNCIAVRWKRSEGDCDQYELTITEKDETEKESVPIPNGSNECFQHAFNGLVPGREYTVSLVAISGREYSRPSRRVQRTIVAKPASLNLSSTEDCIVVEWKEAEGDASGYLLVLSSMSPSDEKKEKFIGSDETLKTVFDQLVPGRVYTVTIHTVVKPINGNDVFSSPVSDQKRTDVKPPKLDLDMATKTSIRVKWPDVHGDRDEYRLRISPTDQKPVTIPVAIEKSFQDQRHTFEGLVPGKRYAITAVTVSGDQESKAETISVRTLVCPPKNIRRESTRTEITVQCDEPDGEYDGLYLQLSPPDAQQSKVRKDKGELCHSFTNLISGSKYKITMVTLNEGVKSEDVPISIQTKVADVDPADLEVAPDGDGKLRTSWKHCEGDKRGYIIVISPNDTTSGPTRFIKCSNPLEYKYTDLVPGRMYSITLYAVSYEERSKGIHQNVRATVAPPRDVSITTKTERSMSVSWVGSKGEVDGYLVSNSGDLGTLTQMCIKHKGEDVPMSYTFQELTPGSLYTVSVTALREDDCSLTISPPPSRTIVSQPNDVQIAEETVNSIRVNWLEANGCKDRYHIEITDAFGHHNQEPEEVALQKDTRDANGVSPQYTYVVKNLTAGKRYLIRVLAESGNDKSDWVKKFGRTRPLPPEEIGLETTNDTDIVVRWKSGEGEFDKHSLFLFSEKVTTGVSNSEQCDRATDKHIQTGTGLPVGNEEVYENTLIHKRYVDVLRNEETTFSFRDLEHGRLYVIKITTKSGDKESESKQVMIRTTVDAPKELRETFHDETCIAVEWDHARGVKDEYIVEITSNNCSVDSKRVEADRPLECVFDGLYPGRLYVVSVRTICGESGFSQPFERIEESLAALQGAAIFSTLDLASGYWQVAVDEADKEKTAFSTQFGLFEFNRLPFGLSGAPASFQRLMQHCLGDQNLETLLIYLDDIIVFSSNFDDHLARLDLVFTRLRAHGLKLRPNKCHLFKRRVKYLGHIVSERGVATDPEKCAVLRDWPVPKTSKQVKSFLGFCSYYRRFVKDFSKIAQPLHKLTIGQNKKGRKQSTAKFEWSTECQQAFDTLRSRLMGADILAYPDFELPFILYIDASHDGLGAVLSQEQKGIERVIAYASRGLKPTERNMDNYSSFKLELLGLKWAVTEKFKDYLYGAKCTPLSVTLSEIVGTGAFEPMSTLPEHAQGDLSRQQRDDPVLDRETTL